MKDQNWTKRIKDIKIKNTKSKTVRIYPNSLGWWSYLSPWTLIVLPRNSPVLSVENQLSDNFILKFTHSNTYELEVQFLPMGTIADNLFGTRLHFFHDTRLKVHWHKNVWLMSNKISNSQTWAYNGNRSTRSNIKISHWNAGNGKWESKRTQIELLIQEKFPDILFIIRSQPIQYTARPHETYHGIWSVPTRSHDGETPLCQNCVISKRRYCVTDP